MMYFFTMREFSGLNIQSHLFISITERHTFTSQTIHFFYTEDKQILIIVKNMFVHFYLVHYIGRHLQAIFQFLESRNKDLFYNLQVTEMILETVKKYRTYTAQLNRITFDIARMPIAELAAEGFDIEQMKKDGAFKLLEVGRQTKLYPVKAVQTGHITKESTYSLHCFFDQNGEIGFKAQSALSEPEYRTDERLRRELTKQDINDLRAKKTLNRLMQHDGEYCFVGFNKDTQRMIYVPCKDVRIPDYIFGQFIGPSRKQEFERGGSVLLENCNYSGNDNHFSGHAHFDVHRRDYVVDDPHYERPYLPEHIRTQMPKEEVDKYFAGEVMKGYRYKGRDGRPFTQDFRLNTETNACEFIDYQKQAASLQQTQTQGPISDPPESMEPQEAPYMAPHIPEEGQDRSQGPRM